MNPNQIAAYQALQQAQQALKAGDKRNARHFSEQAVHAAPELEEVWLMMAALAAPQASVQYLQHALKINPASERAQKGMTWALERLKRASEQAAASPGKAPPVKPPEAQAASVVERTQPTRPVPSPIEAQPAKKVTELLPVSRPRTVSATRPAAAPKKVSRKWLFALPLLALLLCIAAGFVIWWSAAPVTAFFKSKPGGLAQAPVVLSEVTPTPLSAMADLFTFTPSPTEIHAATSTLTATPVDLPSATITFTPTVSSTPVPSATPSITPTEEDTPTPLPTDTAEPTRVIPTRAPTFAPPKAQNPGSNSERWIDVDLTQQMVYAYEGSTLVNSFVVSTGTWMTPTVIGQYRVYVKYRYKDMSGPGYYLKDVPYTMFFYQGYALHGTYWHNNFGTPMSHGCVNLTIPDSEWLYNFASVGTLVNVHY